MSLKPKLKENYLCKVCRKVRFKQRSLTHVICSYECAIKDTQRAKEEREKKEKKQRKERLKEINHDYNWHIKEAQKAFNAYIRFRDRGMPCICCNQPLTLQNNGYIPLGGNYDCGHYRSVGAAPHLRFDERNAHAQRKYCNDYLAGNHSDYRNGLIAKIGLEAVESLEADNTSRNWTKDELKEIKSLYKKKLKDLQKSVDVDLIEQYKEG